MINLLPFGQKKELEQEEILKLVLTFGIIALAFLVSLTLILVSIKFSLLADLGAQEIYIEQKQKELEEPETQELKAKIKEYNSVLSKLEAFYLGQPDLTSIFEEISSLTSSKGIYLTAFKFNSQTSQVSLTGFSPTCEILLQFKENLEKTESLKEVVFPDDTWHQDTNINFLVSFKI